MKAIERPRDLLSPARVVGTALLITLIAFLVAQANYVLFHTAAEGFAIVVAVLIYVVGTRTHSHSKDNFLLFLGNAYLFVAILDFFHTVTYQGTGLLPGFTADTPTQLWIASRYVDALSLFAATFFIRRRVPRKIVFWGYAVVTAALLASILVVPIFPVCFVPGQGLTTFKVGSEYVISAIVAVAIWRLRVHWGEINRSPYLLIVAAMGTTIASELAFTLYTDAYGIMNLVGHLLKILAYYLIFRGIVLRGLEMPYEEIKRLNDVLDRRVSERTADLEASNRELNREIAERRQAEESLVESEERFRKVFEEGPLGMALTGLDRRFIKANGALCRMVGYAESELTGLRFTDITHPEDIDKNVALDEQLNAGEIPSYQFEKRYIRKTGETIWVRVSASYVRNDDGKPIYGLATMEDITQRKLVEETVRKLSRAIEQSPASVVITDTMGRIEFVNPKFTELTGYSLEESLGQNPRLLKTGHTPTEEYARLWDTIRAGRMWRGEFLNKKKNGEIYWESASISPITDSDGAITHFVAVKEDITASKAANQERERLVASLNESNGRLREANRDYSEMAGTAERRAAELQSVLDNMADGVFVADSEGRVTMANEAAVEMLGMDGSHDLRMDVWDLNERLSVRNLDGQPRQNCHQPLARALAGETVIQDDSVFRNPKTGRDLYVRSSASPMRDERGRIVAAVSVARDVTGLAELEQLKDQLITVASHELKTPVTIMKGFAQVLLRKADDLSPERRKILDSIDRGASRIDAVVQELLDVSILTSGKLRLTRERIDLAAFVEQAVDRMALESPRHRLHMTRVELVSVQADRQRLEQVLDNLLDNAIRYSPAGGTIDVEVRAEADRAVVTVRDHGIGIPAHKQSRIFERLYRAHTDTPYDYGGMGVGLYLARAITRLHGGEMDFESVEGAGSTFRFSLPFG